MNQNNFRLVCLGLLFSILTIGLGCSSKKAFKSGITYACDGGRSFAVEFYERVDIAFLMVPGKTFYLHRMPSTSGVRYSDGTTTFSINEGVASIETYGETEFKNCSPKPK